MNILHFGKSHGSHRCKTLNNQAAVTVIKVLLKYLFWTMQMLLKKLWFYQLLKNFLVLEGYILMRESFKIPMEITSHSLLFTNNAPAKRLLCKCCWIKSGTKLLIPTISTATYGEKKWLLWNLSSKKDSKKYTKKVWRKHGCFHTFLEWVMLSNSNPYTLPQSLAEVENKGIYVLH